LSDHGRVRHGTVEHTGHHEATAELALRGKHVGAQEAEGVEGLGNGKKTWSSGEFVQTTGHQGVLGGSGDMQTKVVLDTGKVVFQVVVVCRHVVKGSRRHEVQSEAV